MMTTVAAFVFCAGSSQAQSNQGPKATNYKEVLKGIKYPVTCRENGVEGTVIVLLKISKTGEMVNYQFKSAPSEDLQVAVENSLSQLTFTPAKNKVGQAVAGKLTLPVNFKLSI